MKRSLCIMGALILIMLTIYPSVLADSIQKVTIGKDKIELGMSMSEFKKLYPNAIVIEKDNWLTCWFGFEPKGMDTSYAYVPTTNGLFLKQSFAGYDNAECIYVFDHEQKLESVVIRLNEDYYRRAEMSQQFDTLSEALMKYGNCIAEGRTYIPFNKSAYDALSLFKTQPFNGEQQHTSASVIRETTPIDIKQWLVNQGDSYVDIKLVEYGSLHKTYKTTTRETSTVDLYGIVISYTLCSQELISNLLEEARNNENARNNDL